jgi:hypothetical protein
MNNETVILDLKPFIYRFVDGELVKVTDYEQGYTHLLVITANGIPESVEILKLK